MNRHPPILDMNELAHRMEVPPLENPLAAYAPKKRQEDLMALTVETVDTFGALPTTELDDMIRAAEQEIAGLKTDAQRIRNEYVRRTEALKANIERLLKGCALAKKTLDELSQQVAGLDTPVVPAVMPQ